MDPATPAMSKLKMSGHFISLQKQQQLWKSGKPIERNNAYKTNETNICINN